jgi:hypothetical protein
VSGRSDVLRLVDDTAALRGRLGDLVRTFQGRRRSSKAAKLGGTAMVVLGIAGAAMGARAIRRSGRRPRGGPLTSPVRRRVRWAVAAGVASLLARRFARRALAP